MEQHNYLATRKLKNKKKKIKKEKRRDIQKIPKTKNINRADEGNCPNQPEIEKRRGKQRPTLLLSLNRRVPRTRHKTW